MLFTASLVLFQVKQIPLESFFIQHFFVFFWLFSQKKKSQTRTNLISKRSNLLSRKAKRTGLRPLKDKLKNIRPFKDILKKDAAGALQFMKRLVLATLQNFF
jgi:hypothetical protein